MIPPSNALLFMACGRCFPTMHTAIAARSSTSLDFGTPLMRNFGDLAESSESTRACFSKSEPYVGCTYTSRRTVRPSCSTASGAKSGMLLSTYAQTSPLEGSGSRPSSRPAYQMLFSSPRVELMGFQVLRPCSEILYLHFDGWTPDVGTGVRIDNPDSSIPWSLPLNGLSERGLVIPPVESCT